MHKFLFASLSGNTKLVKLPKHIDLENDIIEDRKEYASEDDAFDLLIKEEKREKRKKHGKVMSCNFYFNKKKMFFIFF